MHKRLLIVFLLHFGLIHIAHADEAPSFVCTGFSDEIAANVTLEGYVEGEESIYLDAIFWTEEVVETYSFSNSTTWLYKNSVIMTQGQEIFPEKGIENFSFSLALFYNNIIDAPKKFAATFTMIVKSQSGKTTYSKLSLDCQNPMKLGVGE